MCRPRRDRCLDFSYEQRHSPIQVSPVKPTKYPTEQWDRPAFGVDDEAHHRLLRSALGKNVVITNLSAQKYADPLPMS